ncbi:TIR domain-containing protein [Ornithinimicrobium faecis]|uniref:site-specific DNA-methyltransferase (adenine-specific) n=1 Tax=Ornithinimicrobium faecis TaxID=2934158 RepID=A0ABY4YSY9_9MICO|nr:type ISP restriction/modification enzyme [Ornithinimicrobium sp. HY1793]USQ79697.1 TIR domain-containing protein [Ornithinimicrobium sp. HY1793]
MNPLEPVCLFISYQRDDEDFVSELAARIQAEAHHRRVAVHVWWDRRLLPGVDWDAELTQQLDEADVFAAVVTPAFLDSDYITRKEIPAMLDRWNRGTHPIETLVPVLPLQFRAVSKNGSPLREMQFHNPTTPLSEQDGRDYEDAFTEYVDALIDSAQTQRDLRSAVQAQPHLQAHVRTVEELARVVRLDPDATPEDSLKLPLQELVTKVALTVGITGVSCTTEHRSDHSRVDIAVRRNGTVVGLIEVKAPNKSGNPARPTGWTSHDKKQWEVLKDHPNLIYTNGTTFTHSRGLGENLDPVDIAPANERATRNLLGILSEFLRWSPIVPSQPRPLARVLAQLARLLRDDVMNDINNDGDLAKLHREWQNTLMPDANAADFADSYAQTFCYALLLARLEGAPEPLKAETAGVALRSHGQSLLSAVLRVLNQPAAREALEQSASLLETVIGQVDPVKFARSGDEWVYFYEYFLASYDPKLRDARGVYYTPVEVVDCQVRLTQYILQEKMGLHEGFASENVNTLDPATGTGSYLLSIIRRTIDSAPARAAAATSLGQNLHGFEILVGPYAVTHLRVTQALLAEQASLPGGAINVALTDTLSRPQAPDEIGTLFAEPLVEEQHRATTFKSSETPVTVVIGNPPYNRASDGGAESDTGGMVRYGTRDEPALLGDFIEPLSALGKGGSAKNLYNDYVYFWRWAIWKACEQHDDAPAVVNFISPSSFLRGPGFAGMRQVLRQQFDELWVIDLGGEKRGAADEPNVFDILTPVAITICIRYQRQKGQRKATYRPCQVRYHRVPASTREDLHAGLNNLLVLDPDDSRWEEITGDRASNLTPGAKGPGFTSWPTMSDLFPWSSRGVQFSRTWPVSQDKSVLERRWRALLNAGLEDQPVLLHTTRDVSITASPKSFHTGAPTTPLAELATTDQPEALSPIWFRSFDTQWCISDRRVIDMPRPGLWSSQSDDQVFLTTLGQPSNGPAVVVAPHVPDLNAFRGSAGGIIYPAFRAVDEPNITPGLLQTLGLVDGPSALVSYIVGITGSATYLDAFGDDVRASETIAVPITKDEDLFQRVRALGESIISAHTGGLRCSPTNEFGHPAALRGSAHEVRPIPETTMPSEYSYDPELEELAVGEGVIGGVTSAVWKYEVSGLRVVQSWLSFRMKARAGRKSSDLDRDILPAAWAQSNELLRMLWSVEASVYLETEAADLLEEVLASELWTADTLPKPTKANRAAPRVTHPDKVRADTLAGAPLSLSQAREIARSGHRYVSVSEPAPAERLTESIEWQTSGGDTVVGDAGDWLVGEGSQRRTVSADVFERTYSEQSDGMFLKTGEVFARQVDAERSVDTLEGIVHAEADDWLVTNDIDCEDVWVVAVEDFDAKYSRHDTRG